jgi:hypothetical protein
MAPSAKGKARATSHDPSETHDSQPQGSSHCLTALEEDQEDLGEDTQLRHTIDDHEIQFEVQNEKIKEQENMIRALNQQVAELIRTNKQIMGHLAKKDHGESYMEGPQQLRREGSGPPPSASSFSTGNYKPRIKLPAAFSDNSGPITYPAWKNKMMDKFETDSLQFPTERDKMICLFNNTEGDANKHLFPRYSQDEDNTDPYQSLKEM